MMDENVNDEAGVPLSREELRDIIGEVVTGNITGPGTPRLDTFSGEKPAELGRWLEDFEYIAEAQNWTNGVKMRKFPLYLTGSAREWHNLYVRDAGEKAPREFEDLKEAFKRVFPSYGLRILYTGFVKKQSPTGRGVSQ